MAEAHARRLGMTDTPDVFLLQTPLSSDGRDLYTHVDPTEYAKQRITETGFFVRFAEIVATHPNLTKRVAVLGASRRNPVLPAPQLREAVAVGGL